MPTKEELAIMSALAYGVGAPPNNLVDPSGWSSSPGPRSEYGLQYRVFVRGAEIVIAYAGTNEPDDLIADLDGALGVPDLQFFAAAQVYAEVRRDHPEIPPENITFTGHSLGGGIASVMAVWFDRQATAFAPAPFQSYVMDGPAQALSVLAQLYLLKNVGPYWGLVSYFAEAQLPAREANVTSYAVVGEFLETPPFTSLNTIEGPDAYHLDIGNEPASRWTRHLMDLHAAATIDATFVHALHELPAAGAAIFDETLYKKKLKSGERDFLRMLLQRRGNGALHNFALDLERLTGTGGVQLLSGGLVAALMDRYMDAPPGPVAQVIDAVSGGVHLVSPVSSYPGRVRLNAAMAGLLFGDDRTAAEGRLRTITDWYVNNDGAAALVLAPHSTDDAAIGSTVTDTLEGGAGNDLLWGGAGDDYLFGGDDNDVLIGSVGMDVLDGGAGIDYLSGGSENDTLSGGAGRDQLEGGDGHDVYAFAGLWDSDVILDSDSDGAITIAGLGTLSGAGAKKLGEGTWQSDDKSVTYNLVHDSGQPDTLVIGVAGPNSGTIRIRNWSSGALGITLGTEWAAAPVNPEYLGDFGKATSGGSYLTSPTGYVSGGALPDAADVINGTSVNDTLRGLAATTASPAVLGMT